MNRRKTAFWVLVVLAAALLIVLTFWAKRYYDYRYALEDHYYTVVPLGYDLTPQWANNSDGDPMERVTYYNLTCYNADGEARQLQGRVRVDMADLYPPGTFLRFSASRQLVIGQRALDEADVPAKALEKIREGYVPSTATTLDEYAQERAGQLGISCITDKSTLVYTYTYEDKAQAEDAAELLDPVYTAQFRTDQQAFPEVTAIFLEIRLEGETVVFSQKYDRRVVFDYEKELQIATHKNH